MIRVPNAFFCNSLNISRKQIFFASIYSKLKFFFGRYTYEHTKMKTDRVIYSHFFRMIILNTQWTS